jgi:putative hydrolase of the HAD superfamily
MKFERQNLLIDADDTLWENNIYFERVIAAAQEMLRPLGVDPLAFRSHLNATELRHIPIYGYGTLNFARSLVETLEAFHPEGADGSVSLRVRELAVAILEHPIEVIDGVGPTLEYLSERHVLFLVTKGDPQEQARKIEASRLRRYFREVEIVADKNASVFRDLLNTRGWDPDRTWMIGNSRRSDIHPALAAGMSAVYIPHPHTWVLEHEDPVEHERLLELERFSDLTNHF